MIVKMSGSASSPVVALDRCEIECVEPERVASVLARLPDERVFQDLAETFRVLSDPGRVCLISALLEAGELCACDLAAVTGLSLAQPPPAALGTARPLPQAGPQRLLLPRRRP